MIILINIDFNGFLDVPANLPPLGDYEVVLFDCTACKSNFSFFISDLGLRMQSSQLLVFKEKRQFLGILLLEGGLTFSMICKQQRMKYLVCKISSDIVASVAVLVSYTLFPHILQKGSSQNNVNGQNQRYLDAIIKNLFESIGVESVQNFKIECVTFYCLIFSAELI